MCHSQIRGVESMAIDDTDYADGEYSVIPSLEVASIGGSQRKYSDTEIADGKVIRMMIDTGADVNVLDAQLVDNLQGIRILPPDKKILAYGPRHERVALPVVGKIIIEIRSIVTNKSITATFYLIRNVDSLLSCVSAEALELVSFASAIDKVKSDRKEMVSNLLAEFSDRFIGLGKMKDV